MKDDIIQSKTGIPYRRCCKLCGRAFPAVSIIDIQAAIPKLAHHGRQYCKPCQRSMGNEGGVKTP